MADQILTQRAVLEHIGFSELLVATQAQIVEHLISKGKPLKEAREEAKNCDQEWTIVSEAQFFQPHMIFTDVGTTTNAQLPDGSNWILDRALLSTEITLLTEAGFVDVATGFKDAYHDFFYPRQ